MAESNPPVWMQSGTYSAADDRMITALLSSRSFDAATGGTLGVDGGVVPGLDQLRASALGNGMVVTIAAGAVVVPASASPPGAYLCYNDGPVGLTLPIETSGNPRTDTIVAEVTDQDISGPGATSEWKITSVRGTPGPGAGAAGALTGYQFPLAYVTVKPASQNGGQNKVSQADITDLRRFNTAQGGVSIKWTGLPFPISSPGKVVYDVSAKKLLVCDGTAWNDVYTAENWRQVLRAVKPRQVTSGAPSELKDHSNWDSTPLKAAATGAIDVIQITDVVTPSGLLKVNVGGFGKIAEASSSGHVSIRVQQGTNVVQAPSYTYGISFYSTRWEHHGLGFMLSGLPENVNLSVKLEFRRDTSGDTVDKRKGTASFRNMLLMVEPVL